VLFLTPLSSWAYDFIVFGHSQDLAKNQAGYKIFSEAVATENVDYIFILGDSDLGDPDILKYFPEKYKEKIYAVPGNHEYSDGIDLYLKNFPYTDIAIETEKSVYLLLDSNKSLEDILVILKRWKSVYMSSSKTILLFTHHRLWDDSVLSAGPYKHDKSYLFGQIYPIMNGFVNYIISGNSKRQHFQDLNISLKNNIPPNISLTYWEESFPNMKAYNVGMGNAQPYATYIKFTVVEEGLIPQSQLVKVSDKILNSDGLLDLSFFSPVLRDYEPDIYSMVRLVFMYIVSNYKFVVGVLCGFLLVYIIVRLRKMDKNE